MLSESITNLLDLAGQVAFITGASRGIGKATAEVLVQAGHDQNDGPRSGPV